MGIPQLGKPSSVAVAVVQIFRSNYTGSKRIGTGLLVKQTQNMSCQIHTPTLLPSRFLSTTMMVAQGKNVIVEELKGITLIGINRPEKRNCVNPETAHELVAAFNEFESNPNSPVAILHGKGGTFCAGFDLSYVSSAGHDSEAIIDNYFFDPNSKDGIGPMGPSRRRLFKKPVIASIPGYAVAGGLELSLMCDMRVVEETTVMGVFCRRFGVPLLDGGTVRLPKLIGLSRALDLILTGRPVKGKEAFEFGLANRITSTGTALGQAVQLAGSLMKYPQECLLRDRESAYYTMFNATSFEDAIRNELQNSIDVLKTESVKGATDFVSGVGRHGSFHLDEIDGQRINKS